MHFSSLEAESGIYRDFCPFSFPITSCYVFIDHKYKRSINHFINNCITIYNQVENGFGSRLEARPENFEEMNTSLSDSESTGAQDSALKSVSSRGHSVPDVTIFRYCLGGLTDRSLLLKEIATTVSDEEISGFAEQVSLYSGCSHHR